MRYCSFEGALPRIVHEHGRPQIGRDWGTPKEANCEGFTVEEFERLDLSDADFSDFTDEMMAKFNSPDENGTLNRIQSSINNLLGNQSPGPGETDEAGKP
jgi:conjugal transfer mating pair stabilization protein TraN